MNTFLEYSDSFKLSCNAEDLDFCAEDSGFKIYDGSIPLLTPFGNSFSHQSERAIRLIMTDLQLFQDANPNPLSSPLLFSFRKDILDTGADPLLNQWQDWLKSDPFVQIKTFGKPSFQPFSPDDPLFSFAFSTLSGLIGIVNSFTGKVMGEAILEESETNPFPELLKLVYRALPADQKTAVQALGGIHRSGIVLPMLLVLREINTVEYVKGLISLQIQPKGLFSEILAGVAGVLDYLGIMQQKPKLEKQVSALISQGEGDSIEFKSTLRWDIRASKTNQAIERACLKTISAFLNSKGGCLLIGVRDDGSIEGIESDRFANEDKFLLHLWTLIRNCLGRDFSPHIRTRLEKADEKTVCLVDCQPSGRPVFLRQPGFDEEMYIRVGPSSNALDISEALKYIKDRFPAR